MRIVLSLIASLATAASVAIPAASPAQEADAVIAIGHASPGMAAGRLSHLGFGKVAAAILPVQAFACSPYEEGQAMCLNGWLWTCQCFSYGCQYMTGSIRC